MKKQDKAKTRKGKAEPTDIPSLGPDFFRKATLRLPPEKKRISIWLDRDLLEFLRDQGPGYQTRINAILRLWYEANRPRKGSAKALEVLAVQAGGERRKGKAIPLEDQAKGRKGLRRSAIRGARGPLPPPYGSGRGPTRDVKRVAGVVDRIEGDIVVIIIKDPDDPEMNREVYVKRSLIKKIELQEGDRVTVLLKS